MVREFRHSVTGRSLRVREGSRTERLVTGDKNWSEVKPETSSKAESTSGGSRGSGDSKRRRGASRKAADGGGDDKG